jgi:hypothetical protein
MNETCNVSSHEPGLEYAISLSRCSLTGVVKQLHPSAPDMDAIRMRYSIQHASYEATRSVGVHVMTHYLLTMASLS